MEPNISMMTEEERQNPSLVKQRAEYNEAPISIYFGSHKDELVDVCLSCKKKDKCEDYKEITRQRQFLKDNAYNPFILVELGKEERDKMANNDYFAINCKEKEV